MKKLSEAIDNQNKIIISNDRIGELLDKINELKDDKINTTNSVVNIIEELGTYRSDNIKNTDQIDLSYSYLEMIKSKLDDVYSLYNKTLEMLEDYNKNGRRVV